MSRTIMATLDRTAEQHGSRPAMMAKRGGAWQPTSWTEYRAQVRQAAKAFIQLGLEPLKGVAIIGYNCPQWFVADVAAIAAGGFPAGIYTTNSPEQCHYIADHSEAQVVVVENAAQLVKFKAIRERLPRVQAYVLMNGEDPDPQVYSWEAFLQQGEQVSDETLQERLDAQQLEDTCTLIYTSGTTGPPKAVMITHANISRTADATVESVGFRPGDSLISYLPLSHIAEQLLSLHGPMVVGGCTWFAEGIEQLGENLREVRPDVFFGVPRVWEKIQAKMVEKGAQNSGLKKKIAAWARKVGLAAGQAEQRGQGRPLFYGLADKLVYSKVRQALGLDRCRLRLTAAAPISRDTLEFFLSLGLPIYEVYGMSESTGPATISLPNRYRTGKCGFVLPGTELKIAEDGEICMRGFHVFKGYLKNPEATKETIDAEGWLHSGDIGTLDAEGFLQITDRKKDLIITAGGENVAPQIIEGQLKSIPVVMQAVVIGDRRKFLSALLTLDPERIAHEAAACGSSARDPRAAAECAGFRAHLQGQIDAVNTELARVQTIKKWTVIPEEFTIEGGELTPTMKIKRKVVNEKHAAAIEAMYA